MFEEVAKIKGRLDIALGEPEPMAQYWGHLKAFIDGKVTKEQFDAIATSLLGYNVSLHNEFILAIFQSAETFPQRGRPARKAESDGPPQRSAVHRSVEQPFGSMLPRVHSHMPVEPEMQRKRLRISSLAAYESASPPLASLACMRARMYIAASEAGVFSVEKGSGELLIAATEIFLKRLLEACVAHRSRLAVSGNFRHKFQSRDKRPISLEDMLTTVTINPWLLNGALQTVRERISSACKT